MNLFRRIGANKPIVLFGVFLVLMVVILADTYALRDSVAATELWICDRSDVRIVGELLDLSRGHTICGATAPRLQGKDLYIDLEQDGRLILLGRATWLGIDSTTGKARFRFNHLALYDKYPAGMYTFLVIFGREPLAKIELTLLH